MFRLPLLEPPPLAALPASESQALPRVRRLRRRDYVGYSAKLASRMLQSRVLGRHRPLLVNIEPTHRCNLVDGFDHEQYAAEAEQRWGNTDAYKESMKRAKGYSKEDWQRCGAEQGGVYGDAFKALQAGMAPESPEAMDIAERHRLTIDRWFYPCSYAMHCGLADMYEQDSRFVANIDKYGAGLTPFLSAAIRANAKRHG